MYVDWTFAIHRALMEISFTVIVSYVLLSGLLAHIGSAAREVTIICDDSPCFVEHSETAGHEGIPHVRVLTMRRNRSSGSYLTTTWSSILYQMQRLSSFRARIIRMLVRYSLNVAAELCIARRFRSSDGCESMFEADRAN